ncbi:MAG TPA: hypothetical protein VEZ11_07120 [Thermoanaerobaculia bacterium]|nr:hypothetical protein [Thermoanaerobaculia bacterium]
MKVSRYIIPLILLGCLAVPLTAQVNDTYVIPVSGNLNGAFGTRWMTRFSVFNPQTQYSLKISVTFVPTGGAVGTEARFTVPANSVAFFDNVLSDVFHVNGSGALLVATFPEDNPGVPNDIVSRAFLVTSDTYNNASSGTYGQTIPGVWAGLQDFNTDGISAIAHGIRDIAAQGWRTNVGAVNLGRRSITMHVTVFDYNGNTILDNAPFTIPPMAHLQDHLPVEVDRGAIEFTVDDPSKQAVVFPYTSTIDQLSGDPSYQSPTLLATPKVLFPKGAMTPTPASLASPGKKLDLTIAREVRANATSIGEVALVMSTEGYRIAPK